jgi:hypothetical protein
MDKNKGFNKIYLRTTMLTLVFVITALGCIGSPISPPIITAMETSNGIQKTVDIDNNPVSALSSNTLNSATIMPLFEPLNHLQVAAAADDFVWNLLGEVNFERALNDLNLLTGEVPICIDNSCYTINNRLTGSDGLQWGKDYVSAELTRHGYLVEIHDWSLSGYSDQNIVARKTGVLHPEEEIYLVAHLDGAKSIWSDKFPAADDNGSGVVDILEVARVLSKYSFERSVVFLISTGEEQGTLGVLSYLDQLTADEIGAIKYAINIDMVGYDANQDGAMELWYGDHEPSLELVTRMNEIILNYQLGLFPEFVVGCG